jgi:riboflavin synthase
MFTGIITDVGRVLQITQSPGKDLVLEIESKLLSSNLKLGSSVCCSGVCLTVIATTPNSFIVEVSSETLSCTNFSQIKLESLINLESSLKFGDELAGHMVTGHVDMVTQIVTMAKLAGSLVISLKLPQELRNMIVRKGSVTLDGVALTVNEVNDEHFTVNIIPYSFDHTNFSQLSVGSLVNLEVDPFARYITKMVSKYL